MKNKLTKKFYLSTIFSPQKQEYLTFRKVFF